MSRKDGKTEDLKNMLISFRIAELQTLLASCGRSRSGRKHELLGRAVSLLKSSEGSAMRERVKTRILELYNQRYSADGVSPPDDNDGNPPEITNNSNMVTYPQPYLPFSNDKNEEPTYLNRPNYHKQYALQPSSRSTNFTCAALQPAANIHPNPHDNRIYDPPCVMHPASAMPIHPDVRFISLPFYDVVDVLIKPTSLLQKTMNGIQYTDLVYHLTPYQTQLITNSRSYHIKSMIEYAVQVQLRFCLAETSCVQEDLYPTRCKVIVNGKSCPIPGQPPPNAQNQEPRKPHRPVNITSFCRLSPMRSNQLQLQWMPSDLGQRYAATVHLVKIVQAEILIQQLSNKPTRSKAYTIGFIKEKLRPDPDSEIAMTSLKVSLCCPIGRTRMTMPCRANNCSHLQCFDGSLYIQMNERKPSWVCPVCDQKAYYEDLFKDGLFTSIINEATNCDDIVFFEDGSWRPLADIQQGQDCSMPLAEVLNTPTPSNRPQSVVDCQTPPILSSNTPPVTTVVDQVSSSSSSIPELQSIQVSEDSTQSEKEKLPEEEDDLEVIMIDDSDSDVEDRVPDKSIPQISNDNNTGPRFASSETGVNQTSSSTLPFSDIQGLELYNLLPSEDRIAAAMYLDQNGLLNQLANVNHPISSPSSIIDISDE